MMAVKEIQWSGRAIMTMAWSGQVCEGVPLMTDLREVVRLGSAVDLEYTFTDQNGAVIDVSALSLVKLHLKRQGGALDESVVTVLGDDMGVVRAPGVVFQDEGVWHAQFVVSDNSGPPARLYGDLVQFRVVKNLADAGQDELLYY